MENRRCNNKYDKDGKCYLDINQEISDVMAGRDVTIKPTINFEYNDDIKKVACEKIENSTGHNCTVEFGEDIIKNILSETQVN